MEMLRWVRKYLVLPKIKHDLIPKPKDQVIDFFQNLSYLNLYPFTTFYRYRLNIKRKLPPGVYRAQRWRSNKKFTNTRFFCEC